MGHIHNGLNDHDFTVSAFIIRKDKNVNKLLLHRHKKLGKYIQIGGHVEVSENPIQALAHELKEESGYDLEKDLMFFQPAIRMSSVTGAVVHPLPVCINTHPFNDVHSHIDMEYALFASELPANKPLKNESDDFLWVSLEELKELPKDQTISNVREIGIFVLEQTLSNWELVPSKSYII